MTPLPRADAASTINLASTVACTEAEGPGRRFAVWTQGCTIGCPDCCNPHLWTHAAHRPVAARDLAAEVAAAREAHDIEGVTLIGGEPFEQDAALSPFAREVRALGLTVMAFTGHRLEELQGRGSPLLPHVDLLVDGPYVKALHTTARRWIGSTNQRLHFLTAAYAPDDPRFAEPNTAEIRLTGDGRLQVVGFPFASVREAFGPAAWRDLGPEAVERARP